MIFEEALQVEPVRLPRSSSVLDLQRSEFVLAACDEINLASSAIPPVVETGGRSQVALPGSQM